MKKLLIILFLFTSCMLHAQVNKPKTVEYTLNIADTTVNYTGKRVKAIAVNGSIPAPTLYFTEGDTAVIHVHNEMNVSTSVHWHGILLPNLMDGVPYLTTPPIEPGKTFTFRFPLIQSGTYWYHSHTMLQEQSGLYGSIVIQPIKKRYQVDGELVLVLSDWTNEKPASVLTTLKRRDAANEYYALEKGYPQSLDKLLKHHAWGERLKAAYNRMPPMDISDVYYNRFFINGNTESDFSKYKPGQKIRLRVINGSASSYFYLQYAGGKMELIAADGVDVQPVFIDRLLMGVAETYDFIITVPTNGAYEFRSTAIDVTGHASVFIGQGNKIMAPDIPKPNVWKMSETIHHLTVNMPGRMNMGNMNMRLKKRGHMGNMPMDKQMMGSSKKEMVQQDNPMQKTSVEKKVNQNMDMPAMSAVKSDTTGKFIMFNYDMLKSFTPTNLPQGKPTREITLNLTGNMYRYVWSINNKTISQQDSIAVKKGENVRLILVNKTMMNHPMHLHGHYFRVLNKNGDYSPLKHTVDVPPMTTVVIEFAANEDKDWFFHCHILYHLASGMARYIHYEGSERDTALANYPLKKILNEDKQWFFYGSLAAKSMMTEFNANYINMSNAIRTEANTNYNGQYEINLSYERYITNWFRPYIGVATVRQKYYNVFSGKEIFQQEFDLPVVGIRYTLPFFIESDLRINSAGRVRLQLESDEWLLPHVFFNWRINTDKEYHLDLQYLLSKYISLSGGYDSRYQWGGGLLVRF
ncbi:multicopper oxidase domain-containing protein [Hydrotalea flava]|uniref:multicopper oxidase domain-containing protein n=1 Tax=Hydrotalea flava TaxID=714549 RepID=UPI00082FBEB8|nr:multicopper oxidase domain-containing protein [Hydrotalea flava]